MKNIPIVFSFDDNLLLPAGVCLFSLLEHAKVDTFYDLFILHTSKDVYPASGFLEKLSEKFGNFRLTYRNVGNIFEKAFEIRGITTAAYHRLLIPEIIPEYDKIMYHDVDVIFRDDLSDIFEKTNMDGYYVAGVVLTTTEEVSFLTDINKLGLTLEDYIISGNLILNSDLLRKDHLVDKFKEEVGQSKYKYQDQDILNIVCKGKIKKMPPQFGMTYDTFHLASYGINQQRYSVQDLLDGYNKGTIHYNGNKPWKTWTLNFDIWWDYYRKSIYFDPKFYFEFYAGKLDEYDRLSFWKRLKILARYFKMRKK